MSAPASTSTSTRKPKSDASSSSFLFTCKTCGERFAAPGLIHYHDLRPDVKCLACANVPPGVCTVCDSVISESERLYVYTCHSQAERDALFHSPTPTTFAHKPPCWSCRTVMLEREAQAKRAIADAKHNKQQQQQQQRKP